MLCKQEVVGSIPSGSTTSFFQFLTVHGYRRCLARQRVFVAKIAITGTSPGIVGKTCQHRA